MNLYEIDLAIERFIAENIDYETGELVNIEGFNELNIAKEQKLESIAIVIKNLTYEAESIKAEKKTLDQRQKVLENDANRLKEYLSNLLDGEKFKTSKVDIGFRKSESVEIVDIEQLPSELVKVKTTKEADKVAIKKAIKNGDIIDGAVLVEKKNINIK